MNGRRKADPNSFEYELLDTGVFDEDRYFDVVVEYAKRSPSDILVRISVTNRGPEPHTLHLLPTLWFRNTWSWTEGQAKPVLRPGVALDGQRVIDARHPDSGPMRLVCEGAPDLLFVDNETNSRRLYGAADGPAFPKDGINDFIVGGDRDRIDPAKTGTKAAAHYRLDVGPGEIRVVRLRLTDDGRVSTVGDDHEAVFTRRQAEADAFYAEIAPYRLSDERRAIQRQALAGMLWSKQFYHYVVDDWLEGDRLPPPGERLSGRNARWSHFYAEDILSMPDKWEYPWFASWDLCFHAVVLAMVDSGFAKQQVSLLSREWYMSPEGQVPAYEWAFEDVNPPLHAWAAWRIYQYEKERTGEGDAAFLKAVFQRCLLYFTWWVNRKDADGNNLFQGGFLGLDNIGVFDRTASHLPPGVQLYQSDGTSWMGFFALEMMRIALELAKDEKVYLEVAAKFFQHFVYIADAMNHITRLSDGAADLWDEEDGFYFDVLRVNRGYEPMKVYSLVGLMPLLPVGTIDLDLLESDDSHGAFRERVAWFVRRQPQLMAQATRRHGAHCDTLLLSFVDPDRLRRLLHRMLDEDEFLSPYGVRSVSRRHAAQPYTIEVAGEAHTIDYEPAESRSGVFGGNSNWRGPVWFPVNVLLIEALRQFHRHFGDGFKVECPTGSGVFLDLAGVADDLSRRLIRLFERGSDGNRPMYGGTERFQRDPLWKDLILFHEYFHGDNGAGLGASHQTGWTGLVAKLIEEQALADEGARTTADRVHLDIRAAE